MSASDTAAARALATDGLKLAKDGQCDLAVDKLSRAERLRHSPIVLGSLGECLIALGKVVEGTEALRQVLREIQPEDVRRSLVRARERAVEGLAAATPRISNLTISLLGPVAQATITIDGQIIPHELLGNVRPSNPGEHEIKASAPGCDNDSKQLNLAPGAPATITLTLRCPTAAPLSDTVVAPRADLSTRAPPLARADSAGFQPPRSRDERSDFGHNHLSSYLLWAAGAASVVAGSVFGVAALTEKRKLDSNCLAYVCPASEKGTIDTARRNANLSTILFGAGAAASSLGVIFYFAGHTTAAPGEINAGPRLGAAFDQLGFEIRRAF